MGGDQENVTLPVIFPPLVLVLQAAMMGNEPALAFLKRKSKAEFSQGVHYSLHDKYTSHSLVLKQWLLSRVGCMYTSSPDVKKNENKNMTTMVLRNV